MDTSLSLLVSHKENVFRKRATNVFTGRAVLHGMIAEQKLNNCTYVVESYMFLKNEEKIQLDTTYYFIMLMLGSICFGHHYAHHQELTTIALVTT